MFCPGKTDILEFPVKLLQSTDQPIMSDGYKELPVCHCQVLCFAKIILGYFLGCLGTSIFWFQEIILMVSQVLAINSRGRSCYYGGVICNTSGVHD